MIVSVRYFINPKLNMLLYIFEGIATASEFFEAAGLAELDERRKWGMTTVLGLLEKELEFELPDLFYAVSYVNEQAKTGLEPEPLNIISNSKGIQLTVDAIKLFPGKVPLKIDVFYTIEEAIMALGLSEQRQEVIQFWKESKSMK